MNRNELKNQIEKLEEELKELRKEYQESIQSDQVKILQELNKNYTGKYLYFKSDDGDEEKKPSVIIKPTKFTFDVWCNNLHYSGKQIILGTEDLHCSPSVVINEGDFLCDYLPKFIYGGDYIEYFSTGREITKEELYNIIVEHINNYL